MRAVMATLSPDILAFRKETGADRYDEMWEGVLHMVACPNREHQNFEWSLETWLRLNWARPRKCRVFHQINLSPPGGWPNSFRVPDLVLLTPPSFAIDKNEYFEGAPDAVVEIRSPGDESYEKLPFYARLGVPECWIIDRDTKVPQLFSLLQGGYAATAPVDGWLVSGLGIALQAQEGRLGIRVVPSGDVALLPEADEA